MILVDEPLWPGRGRLWSHLVSDVSYAELHAFAEMLGSPRRAFDRDHYDIPESRFRSAVWLGATLLPSRELAARLRAAGLRRPKHAVRGLATGLAAGLAPFPAGGHASLAANPPSTRS